jgi:hypothetical protein
VLFTFEGKVYRGAPTATAPNDSQTRKLVRIVLIAAIAMTQQPLKHPAFLLRQWSIHFMTERRR